jgi:hypothetical protein
MTVQALKLKEIHFWTRIFYYIMRVAGEEWEKLVTGG